MTYRIARCLRAASQRGWPRCCDGRHARACGRAIRPTTCRPCAKCCRRGAGAEAPHNQHMWWDPSWTSEAARRGQRLRMTGAYRLAVGACNYKSASKKSPNARAVRFKTARLHSLLKFRKVGDSAPGGFSVVLIIRVCRSRSFVRFWCFSLNIEM